MNETALKRTAGLFVSMALMASLVGCQAGPPSLALFGEKEARASSLTASGFIEADQVSISAEFGGKITQLTAQEGDAAKAGQVLVALDDSILQKQINQAQMAIEVGRANLALIKAGARDEEIRQRKASLAQTEALRDGAKTAWDNARALRDNPQDLKAKVVVAQGQLDTAARNVAVAEKVRDNALSDYQGSLREAQAALAAANLQVQQAQTGADQAEKLRFVLQPPITTDNWIRPPYGIQNTLQYDLNVFQAQSAQAALGMAQANRDIAQSRVDRLLATQSLVEVTSRQYESAVAVRDAAQAVLNDATSTRQNPLTIKNQVDAAEAAYRQSLAAVDVARAALDGVQAGASKEQVAVVQAQVNQAESALQVLLAQKDKMTIVSPVSGTVAEKAAQRGENVLPGVAILKIVNLETVTLRVFVPETAIGQLKLGAPASVNIDSYPGRSFPGQVTFISPQAEFTPKDIQTQEERTKIVFAIKITLPNPEGILKPGMPADATVGI